MDDATKETIIKTATLLEEIQGDVVEIKEGMKVYGVRLITTEVKQAKMEGSFTILTSLVIGILLTLAGAATWVLRGWAVK